ncbi:response regulator [Aquabacterium sp. OR-4]|uniref:response regulator n=1 Tax=Aquabacterium sp. OR-4 TaxID=2978127 RepID=UPI0021B3A631|nr:response regulator [Aquabacterium sp. OR-4]MDT7834299.1 response regulator [Aquabacterium sp. OR-4]
MRVLLIEDDTGLAQALAEHLGARGHAVDCAGTLAAGWACLTAEPFDLLLLDLGLPDGDGLSLLRRLRAARSTAQALPERELPVLVMTARDDVASRIAALDEGADDHVGKPFDPDELAARMRALRRRSAGRADPRLQCGALSIDPSTRQVTRQGQAVALSGREFALLLALAEQRPQLLSRAQLQARLYAFEQGPDSNTIEVHIHHLRRKLGEDVIRTVRGVGYHMPADPA